MEIVLIKSYTGKPWRSSETYQLIEESLKEKWHVHCINTKNPVTLYSFITGLQRKHGKKIFVFNVAEYLDEENKIAFLPELLEEWKIPHLGSSAKSIEIGLNKGRTKELLRKRNILTPRSFVMQKGEDASRLKSEKMAYPMIVKPLSEGGHIGIREDSIVHDNASLMEIVGRVFDVHDQPALVEEYITGEQVREFSVGIIAGERTLFTPIEIDYESMDVEKKILSYEAAQKDLERTKLISDRKMREEVIDLTKKTFAAVGASDYSRVDLRMNSTGCYVLEINIMPGIGPHSFLPVAAENIHGIKYNQLIQMLVENSIRRQKVYFNEGNRRGFSSTVHP